jgi:hypothetical protein
LDGSPEKKQKNKKNKTKPCIMVHMQLKQVQTRNAKMPKTTMDNEKSTGLSHFKGAK